MFNQLSHSQSCSPNPVDVGAFITGRLGAFQQARFIGYQKVFPPQTHGGASLLACVLLQLCNNVFDMSILFVIRFKQGIQLFKYIHGIECFDLATFMSLDPCGTWHYTLIFAKGRLDAFWRESLWRGSSR